MATAESHMLSGAGARYEASSFARLKHIAHRHAGNQVPDIRFRIQSKLWKLYRIIQFQFVYRRVFLARFFRVSSMQRTKNGSIWKSFEVCTLTPPTIAHFRPVPISFYSFIHFGWPRFWFEAISRSDTSSTEMKLKLHQSLSILLAPTTNSRRWNLQTMQRSCVSHRKHQAKSTKWTKARSGRKNRLHFQKIHVSHVIFIYSHRLVFRCASKKVHANFGDTHPDYRQLVRVNEKTKIKVQRNHRPTTTMQSQRSIGSTKIAAIFVQTFNDNSYRRENDVEYDQFTRFYLIQAFWNACELPKCNAQKRHRQKEKRQKRKKAELPQTNLCLRRRISHKNLSEKEWDWLEPDTSRLEIIYVGRRCKNINVPAKNFTFCRNDCDNYQSFSQLPFRFVFFALFAPFLFISVFQTSRFLCDKWRRFLPDWSGCTFAIEMQWRRETERRREVAIRN